MVRSKATRPILFFRLLAISFFLFVFFAYKIQNYDWLQLSPGGLFNNTLGSFLFGFFIFGLIVTIVAIVVFFYFILHDIDG
ncbi:MAG: hypothetical protein ACP5NS_03920 [Candidatus Pacearchaeota archaeon]